MILAVGCRVRSTRGTLSEDEEPVRLCNDTDVYDNDRVTADLPVMEGSATNAEIERMHDFQKKHETTVDPNRTSSNLTKRGDTRPEDR